MDDATIDAIRSELEPKGFLIPDQIWKGLAGETQKWLLEFGEEYIAMAEYLRGMPCPSNCVAGLVPSHRNSIDWVPCTDRHHAKLRELGITDRAKGAL